jgi:organic radical activating enzyme
MLTGLHFILTYTCNFECDHCFLYCSPWSDGTFTIGQVTEVLNEAQKIGTVDWIYFEGGEPFLYFPLLNESVRRSHERGFKVGVVTNGYGALSEEDAELWLSPLAESGLSHLDISNDTFHYGKEKENPAAVAVTVAERLGIETSSICIEPPKVLHQSSNNNDKGSPVVGGDAKFRGRAADKLSDNLPRRAWEEMRQCPYEDLESPSRVHVDPFGNVLICQGISIGNMWQAPLSEIIRNYSSKAHPICGPLIRGGPAELAKALGVKLESGYIDECHICYLVRREAADSYPDFLCPRQVYGLD